MSPLDPVTPAEDAVDRPTLHGQLAATVERQPDRLALLCGTEATTYRELDQRSTASARRLLALGLRPGDRVGYLAKESVAYYELLYACAKASLVLVPINWRLTASEVAHILADSGAACVFHDAETAAALGSTPETIQTLPLDDRPTHWADLTDRADRADPGDGLAGVSATADSPVVQLYTSGTTGLPKGVVLAHRSFFAVGRALRGAGLDWIDFRPDDVSLIGIPGFHIGGLWWATQGLNAGITNVAVPTFVSSQIARLIAEHRVSTGCLVPAMLQMVLDEPVAQDGALRSLRKVVYGGAPISERLLTRCLNDIGCEFAQIYGLTETGNTSVCLPPDQHRVGGPRLSAAGRPYPGFEIDILDEEDRSLPVGEVGQIAIRTPAAMLEYWHNPEATAETLVDGWIRTGDAGRVDEEGYVFITDRIKDAIVVAGENVYPAEIEAVLNRHPGVRESAVIARPDDRWGESVHAVIVREDPDGSSGDPVTPRALSTWLARDLAAFKIPGSFEFIDVLPRNPSGKILRRTLREKHWADTDREVN